MKFWVLAFFLAMPAAAMQRITGTCERGGQPIVAPPAVGQPPLLLDVMRNYPGCFVGVYITGSGGQLATIYSNNAGQGLSNPFQADLITGDWGFYASNGVYDIQLSGGGLAAPRTLGAQTAFDSTSFVPIVPFTNVTSGTSNGALVLAGSLTTTSAGIINFTQAAHTSPFLTGATSTRPATCGVGEAFFATDAPAGQNLIGCTAINTWTQLGGSSGGGGSGFLPLSGGTMTGAITTAPIQGAVYVPYPGNIQMQVGPMTGQNPNCSPGFGNCPDATLVDYFGFEGTFFRVKGGGDYFDFTRWTSGMAALPVHQLALNDSSFNNLLLVDETAGYPQAQFNFTGFINSTAQIKSNQGFLSSLYRNNNGLDYFDWTTTGLGTHAFDLRDSSNTPIVTYRNTSASPGGGVFTFSGEVSTPPTSSVGFQAPIYRLNNGLDYFDWLNIGLGTHAFDIRDSFSSPIFQYRNNPFTSSSAGTFTMTGNLVVTGTCTGCGTGGGGSITGMAPIVSTTTGGTTTISCPNCLPITGGTMTGPLTLQSGCPVWCTGALYLPYGSNLEMQPGPMTGQSTMCTPSSTPATSCPDTTLVDYFGFEGVFFRIKGGGNYFDWTRWTSGTTALPAGQLNLNNVNFQTLLNVNDTFGAGMTQFNFTGFINSTLQIKSSQGVDAPIYKLDNGSDYFEWINTGLGTRHFQIQNSSSYGILDYANPGGVNNGGTFTFNGNVTVTGTCTGCSPAGSGVTAVTPTAPIVASITGSTLSVSCPTCGTTSGGTVTSLTGTAAQVLVNNTSGTATSGVITLTTPQNIDANSVPTFQGVLLNAALPDGNGYSLEIHPQAGGTGGGIEVVGQKTIFLNGCTVANCINIPTGGVTASTYWQGTNQLISSTGVFIGSAVSVPTTVTSNIGGTGTAFQTGSGAFKVLGSGATSVALLNISAGGTLQFNASPALRYNGTVPSGNVQFSNDGGTTWTNMGGSSGGGVTSVTQGSGISVAPTTGNVIVTNTGVISVTGTPSQVITTAATGNITLSLPQSIATGSVPTFAGLLLNTTTDNVYTLQIGGGEEIKGQFTLYFNGCSAGNCVNVPTGGVSANNFSIATGPSTFGTVISNASGGQFIGAGGVSTSGAITTSSTAFNSISTSGGIASASAYYIAGSPGVTRNIVTGSCTINVNGGIITGSSGC